MPKITNSTEKTTPIVQEPSVSVDYEKMIKENEELRNQLNALLSKSSDKDTSKSVSAIKAEVPEEEMYTEPSSNKRIKIMSLYYGELNLAKEYAGKPKIEFNKYGQIKSVLYSDLTDIVNTNMKFQEDGRFYILDKSAVYYLGLSEIYKSILPKDAIDKICDFDTSDISSILDTIPTSQKDVICHNIEMSIFNGENIDFNKVDVISRKFGIDIKAKAEEMKKFDIKE